MDGGVRIAIDLTQSAGSVRAKGSFSFTDAASTTFEATDLGVLQTMKGWASFTAILRSRGSGEPQAATVIVEHADPFVGGNRRTVTIRFESGTIVSSALR